MIRHSAYSCRAAYEKKRAERERKGKSDQAANNGERVRAFLKDYTS